MIREAVYKITENCPCNCLFCDSKEKYENILKHQEMNLEQWKLITDKLVAQGLEVVVISGGEPLLKPEITLPLINYLRERGVFVVLNASGALFYKNNPLLEDLKNSFPDLLVFSIDSSKAEKHDQNRNLPGLFNKVIDTLTNLSIDEKYPVAIRTVITKSNYKEIPEIINKFSALGVQCIKLTNIENDTGLQFTLNINELNEFNDEIKPQIIEELKKCDYENQELLSKNIQKINRLLDKTNPFYKSMAESKFSPDLKGDVPCDLNGRFFAIQSNGDILPCCEAEHHYEPLLGNILKNSVEDILNSEVFKSFAKTRPYYCVTCTQRHNLQLDFKEIVTKVDRR